MHQDKPTYRGGARRSVFWLITLALALVASACQFIPSNLPGSPDLSTCMGEPATIGIGYSDGAIFAADPVTGATYAGTESRDVVVITNGPVTFDGLGGDDLVCVRDLNGFPSGTGSIVVNGGPGADHVVNESSVPLEADGGPGDDILEGGSGDDTLIGGADTDVLIGGDGTDVCVAELATDPATMCDGSNIVLVLVDDLDETTTSYWDAMPQTKALLADTGLTFEETFATNPVCCPARATLLTGQYPHNTGVLDGTPPDGGWPAFVASGAENDTIGTRLQAAGYRTSYMGKYMNFYNDAAIVPPGWDDWFVFTGFEFYDGYDYEASDNGVATQFGTTPADYQTDVLGAEAVGFIAESEIADDDAPFFLLVSPTAPHAPLEPAPRHLPNPFGADPLPTRPNFDEADVSDKASWLRDGRPPLSAAEIQELTDDHRNRMGSLLAVDEMMVDIVDELVLRDELDETVIIFTSDNGYNLGAHRMNLKQLPYDESAEVPLVIAGVDVGLGTISELVTHADLAPTIVDLAGLDPSDMDGISIVPLIDGSATSWRSDFLIQFIGTYSPWAGNFDTAAQVQAAITNGDKMWAPSYRAVRSRQWLYIEWYSGPTHEYELYDVTVDPYQLDNLLVTEPGVHTATAAALQLRIDALSTCAGATCQT